MYTVDFTNVTCTCSDFERYQSLCKHFWTCFIYLPNRAFDNLPSDYRQNPLNQLEILNEIDVKEHQPENQPPSCTKMPDANKQLCTLREKLKNMIDMTYNFEEGIENISMVRYESKQH